MPVRSYIVQLQAGVGQATLPDHRKMVPGVQYVVDADTFAKISLGARQNIIQVTAVNSDSTTTAGSFLPAKSQTTANTQLSLQTLLTVTGTTTNNFTLAGFAAQGYDAGGTSGANIGIQIAVASGASQSQTLRGPAGERYVLVYNAGPDATAGSVLTWYDEEQRLATANRPAYYVRQDGQGTQYVPAGIDALTGVASNYTFYGIKAGGFAGVTIATLPAKNFGWIQVEGICPAVAISGAVQAGNTLSVSAATASGQVQAATAITVNSAGYVQGTALANNTFGTALTAGTNASVVVDIRSRRAKKPYNRFYNDN